MMALPGPREIRRLLDHLVRTQERTVVLDGVAGLLEAEEGREAIPPTIRASIDRSRRMVYRGQGYLETGMFETRLGLIFLDNQYHRLAAERFSAAIIQWQLADDRYLVALAELATGLANHHAFGYEEALDHYQSVHEWLAELQTGPLMPAWKGRQGERDQFLEGLNATLAMASEELQASIGRLSGQRSVSVQEAAAPIIDAALSKPRLRPSGHGSALLHINSNEPLSVAALEGDVLAALKAVEQIDNALALLYDWPGAGLLVTRLELGERVTVRIRGQSPATVPFVRRWLSETALNGISERQRGSAGLPDETERPAGAGVTSARAEATLETARRIVRQSAPNDVAQARIEATAWRLLPAMHDLVEIRSRKSGLSIEEIEDKG